MKKQYLREIICAIGLLVSGALSLYIGNGNPLGLGWFCYLIGWMFSKYVYIK